MRHKYATEALVLARTPIAEASALVTLLTKELGLIRARAQGVRKPGAKLAGALQSLTGSDIILLRGKEGWRLSGAILSEDYFETLTPSMRMCAGRIAHLIVRMLSGESTDSDAYVIFEELLRVLPELDEEEQERAEILAALYLLQSVGVDAGDPIPDHDGRYGREARVYAEANRKELIVRVNRGIEASGL